MRRRLHIRILTATGQYLDARHGGDRARHFPGRAEFKQGIGCGCGQRVQQRRDHRLRTEPEFRDDQRRAQRMGKQIASSGGDLIVQDAMGQVHGSLNIRGKRQAQHLRQAGAGRVQVNDFVAGGFALIHPDRLSHLPAPGPASSDGEHGANPGI